MLRQALPLLLLATLTSGCASGPTQALPVQVDPKPAARIAPACMKLAGEWHCQELVPAGRGAATDRQRVPGILL